MKKYRIAPLLGALFLLLSSGCISLPPLNFTPKDVPQSAAKLDADLRSISVSVTQDSEKKGSIDFNMGFSQTVPDLWKAGVEDTLNRALVFSDSSTRKINLRITIMKFDMPAMGISMHTKTIAQYEIQDRETGATLFTEEITSEGVVPGNYAFTGAIRAMESANRAVQANILSFLSVLQSRGLIAKKNAG